MYKRQALCIAEGFEKDFSVLSKEKNRIASAIASGLQVEKFYLAETDGTVTGIMAISNCRGRAAYVDYAALRKYLGLLKGVIAGFVLKEEFDIRKIPKAKGIDVYKRQEEHCMRDEAVP